MLPSICLSNGREPGIVSVRSLIKKFGSSSGVELEVRRIVASPNWAKSLAASTISGFGMVYHPHHILAQNSVVAFC